MTVPADLARLAGVVSDTCARATGHRLPVPDAQAWPAAAETEDSFRRLVSNAYVWLHDEWTAHVRFFCEIAGETVGLTTTRLRLAEGDLVALRTFHQHPLDPALPRDARTLRDVERWTRESCGRSTPTNEREWAGCAEALLSELEAAVREVIPIAREVERTPALADRWLARFPSADIDLVALREEIATDLGLSLRGSNADYVDRAIGRSWQRRTGRAANLDAVGDAKAVVLRELTAWSTPQLTIGLDDLMDRLGLEPGRSLLGAMRVAQGLSVAIGYDSDDELLDAVAAVWTTQA